MQAEYLPAGWRWTTLGEICKLDKSLIEPKSPRAAALSYVSMEDIEGGSGRILGSKEAGEALESVNSVTFAFDERHILYGKLRPYLNKVALPDFKGRCSTELVPILPNAGIDREFLCWFLRRDATVEAAMKESTGSRMPRADMQAVFALPVPLPPLAEQQSIAVTLRQQFTAVETARTAAEAQLATLRTLPTALLRRAFDPQPAPVAA